ncbi:MAG: DUF2817 domain-containing protein, partial [Burkholderiales bacterium]|nr:DUF2817 domain-containing protein [Burkholderiales bacterium]
MLTEGNATPGLIGRSEPGLMRSPDYDKPMTGSEYFSNSYEAARSRFIAAACAAGATMDELHLGATGPTGSPLAIEIASFGLDNPSRVLIHHSGIHGVEGFAGSAIQLALLDSNLDVPADASLIL